MIVPLGNFADGSLYINASFPLLNIRNVSMRITVSPITFAAIPSRDPMEFEISIDAIGFRYEDPFILTTDAENSLSVFYHGMFFQFAGPLAFINGYESVRMIGRSSLDVFVRRCDDASSFFRFQLSVSNSFRGYLSLGNTTSAIENIQVFGSRGPPLRAPYWFVESIIESLQRNGAILENTDRSRTDFRNCSQSAIDLIPPIAIHIPRGRGVFGTIVLSPEDYMLKNEDESRCSITITLNRHFFFNPFAVKNVNIRLSDDNYWELCDSGNE